MTKQRSSDAAAPGRSSDDIRDEGDDLLREATECLREPEPVSPRLPRATRARILSELHAQRRRRSSRLAVLVPLAAILVGSTAWAGATGRLQQMLHEAMEAIVRHDRAAESTAEAQPLERALPGGRHTASPAAAEPEPPPEPQVDALDEDLATEVVAEPHREPSDETAVGARPPARESAAPLVVAGAEPSGTSSAADDAELVAYRSAHRLHFGGGEAAETVAAWDEYLARWPAGRFALEARYNRAVCLVRMGRSAAAVQALKPFAEGRHGAYRQAEAARLIEALQSKTD